MQESMQARLDLPDVLPRWATDSGVTLEPDPGEKDVGWGTPIRPPARWLNWIQNTIYEWVRRIGSVAVGNWNDVYDATFTDDTYAIIFHPELNIWSAFDNTGAGGITKYSADGKIFLAGTALAAAPLRAAIDSLRLIVGLTNGNIQYSTSIAFAAPSTVTPGIGGGQVYALETAYPDSNLILAGGTAAPFVRIASDVTAAWASATTQPAVAPMRFMRIGATNWLSTNDDFAGDIRCYRSDDDGVNWSQQADIAAQTSLTGSRTADVNVNTQTVVAGGDDGGGNGILAYSADMGVTWQDAVFSDLGQAGNVAEINAVYYCGGDLWLAAADTATLTTALWASADDGRTWQPVTVDYVTTVTLDDFRDIGCNGRFLVVAGDLGTVHRSLAIVGSHANVTPF